MKPVKNALTYFLLFCDNQLLLSMSDGATGHGQVVQPAILHFKT